MSANSIKEAAKYYFAKNGYEGTSLAQIAERVGIKKQSIYSHFDGKDDLFLQVINDALKQQLSYLHAVLLRKNTFAFKENLQLLLQDIMNRFSNDRDMKFWLRMSFYPPTHLIEEVNQAVYHYENEQMELLEPIFRNAIEEETLKKREPACVVTAFISLMNAIRMELVYGGIERAKQVLDPTFEIFWDGVSNVSEGVK